MKLYSYIIARDYGFAPNPFYGSCTLATCKPEIRRRAQPGDWVIGTGSGRYGLAGHLVYAMRVDLVLSYDDYWRHPDYQNKKPCLHGSLKQAFGDNIYHKVRRTGRWIQADSHHSFRSGKPNRANIQHDTRIPRVLISHRYWFWGSVAPRIPRKYDLPDSRICCTTQGDKCRFPVQVVRTFVAWVESHADSGYIADPILF